MNRREFLRSLVASSVLIGIGVIGIDQMINLTKGSPGSAPPSQILTLTRTTTGSGASSESTQVQISGQISQQTTTASPPQGYVLIAPQSQLSGKTYAYFNHPSGGSSILVNVSGQWKAFSAVCTHRPCTVDYTGSGLYCPCHGGSFSTANGAVTGGPPPSPLAEYGVQLLSGNVYVSSSRIN
jgi:Rieske Fe-S protein